MNRRTFIGTVVATAMASRIVRSKSYGFMSFERWFAEGHMGKRVLCNGLDVTDQCREFDDVKGYAQCYVNGSDGMPLLDRDTWGPVMETLRGRIEVIG